MVSDPIAYLWMWVWMVGVLRKFGYRRLFIGFFLWASFFFYSSPALHGFMCTGPCVSLREAPSGGDRSLRLEAESSDSVCEGGEQGLEASASFLLE
jgi:hypothetical protein